MTVQEQLQELAGAHGYGLVLLPSCPGQELMGTLRCLRGERLDIVGFGPSSEQVMAVLLDRLRLRVSFENLALRPRMPGGIGRIGVPLSSDAPAPGRSAGGPGPDPPGSKQSSSTERPGQSLGSLRSGSIAAD